MVQNSIGPPPLSRPFLVDEWREDEASVMFEADERERAGLAAELGVPAIAALAAEFTLTRRGHGRIDVHGLMLAKLTRICVVSLDPFETEVSEPINVAFAPEPEAHAAQARLAGTQEVLGSAPIDEPPDPIIDGRIDLGALAAEFLALGLDPYPRKPGVDFAPPTAPGPAVELPFAVLARLKGQGGPAKR